jgi:hypothetical protein
MSAMRDLRARQSIGAARAGGTAASPVPSDRTNYVPYSPAENHFYNDATRDAEYEYPHPPRAVSVATVHGAGGFQPRVYVQGAFDDRRPGTSGIIGMSTGSSMMTTGNTNRTAATATSRAGAPLINANPSAGAWAGAWNNPVTRATTGRARDFSPNLGRHGSVDYGEETPTQPRDEAPAWPSTSTPGYVLYPGARGRLAEHTKVHHGAAAVSYHGAQFAGDPYDAAMPRLKTPRTKTPSARRGGKGGMFEDLHGAEGAAAAEKRANAMRKMVGLYKLNPVYA